MHSTTPRSIKHATQRPAAALAGLVTTLALLLGGCAALAPVALPVGSSVAELTQARGSPTGDWPLTDGGRQLEYATGPFGNTTWMYRFDAAGRLVSGEQVLTEANFFRITAGMTGEDVRRQIGRPSTTFQVARPPQVVWAYRYNAPFCQWFLVGVGADKVVMDTSFGPDPLCDVNDPPDKVSQLR
ncbi:MAG: hypothetical protein CFE46_11325 [Burkholderiales bacterium PBB6]|jgi:hypothetical protein|nr:MAG: hypothetical protein CFE46_11325 [Burkholderiales bacterium PBB6]